MKTTIANKLIALGWTAEEARAVKCSPVGGGKVSVSPAKYIDRDRFMAIKTDAEALLGSRIEIPGDGEGPVEWKKAGLYVGGNYVTARGYGVDTFINEMIAAGALVES